MLAEQFKLIWVLLLTAVSYELNLDNLIKQIFRNKQTVEVL